MRPPRPPRPGSMADTTLKGAVGASIGTAAGAGLTAAGATQVGGAITAVSTAAVEATSAIPVVGSVCSAVSGGAAAAGTAVGGAVAATLPGVAPFAIIGLGIWGISKLLED